MIKQKIKNTIFSIKINKLKIKSKNYNKILEILSDEEKNKFNKFKDKQSAKRYMVGKFMTRKIISDLTKIEPKKIIFKTNKFGRPALVFPVIKNFDFNLSHSGDWVVLVIADCRVGIDVEEIRSIDLRVANNYFHEKEIKFVFSKKGKELDNFYKIWTLKESYIKAIGRGLSCPLKNIYFEFKKNNQIILHSKLKKQNWYFKMYYLEKNFKLSLCVKDKKILRIKRSLLI